MAHTHSVYDTDNHFIVDENTREITSEQGEIRLIQYDHNSERFTFEIPRYIDGHDMMNCNKIEVHYNNKSRTKSNEVSQGVYPVEDLQISPDSEEIVTCNWLISQVATKYAGSLHFCLRFACLTDSIIDYQWFTKICKEVEVSEGIYNSDVVAEEYVDILESWKIELMEAAENPTIVDVFLPQSGWVGDASPYSQVVTIEGATANSQVDLTPSVEQLTIFHQKDLTFVAENENGIITVYAVGDKPTNDYTIQATVTEVRKS